jgi:quercetin dioxygenase-like cupin family protein
MNHQTGENHMRKYIVLCAILLVSANTTGTLAGGNDLFEAKTSTAAIEETSTKVLSSVYHHESKVTKTAAQASRDALKAYKNCPSKPHKARMALKKSVRNLDRHQGELASVSTTDDSITALAEFGYVTRTNIEALLNTDTVCDQGATLLQSELSYGQAAPFVSFASGWGNMPFGAHGSFGDFSAASAAPDHIHSETYYGVVISGLLKNPFGEMPNNDIGNAKELPAGSFWSVPANATHTTACEGVANCVFYFHSRGAFDFDTDVNGGETMDADSQEISVDEIATELGKESAVVSPFARMFTLWGDRTNNAHGTIGEFISGGESLEHTHSYSYHGVVLSGTMVNPFLGQPVGEARHLQAGDYWFVPAEVEHVTACISAEPCTFYFHSEGLFEFVTTAGNG